MGANNLDEMHVEKIVIVAGPSFGTAMKFVLFGAALGASAVTLLNGRTASTQTSPSATNSDAVNSAEKNGKETLKRLAALTSRAKILARQARELAASTRDSVAPVVGDALLEARATARANEEKLREDLSHPPDAKISDGQA